jgi:hypothetical protein
VWLPGEATRAARAFLKAVPDVVAVLSLDNDLSPTSDAASSSVTPALGRSIRSSCNVGGRVLKSSDLVFHGLVLPTPESFRVTPALSPAKDDDSSGSSLLLALISTTLSDLEQQQQSREALLWSHVVTVVQQIIQSADD